MAKAKNMRVPKVGPRNVSKPGNSQAKPAKMLPRKRGWGRGSK